MDAKLIAMTEASEMLYIGADWGEPAGDVSASLRRERGPHRTKSAIEEMSGSHVRTRPRQGLEPLTRMECQDSRDEEASIKMSNLEVIIPFLYNLAGLFTFPDGIRHSLPGNCCMAVKSQPLCLLRG
jgi:hypothetical protein